MKRGYRRKSPSKNLNSIKDPRNLSKNKHVRRELTENENETPKERVAITKETLADRKEVNTIPIENRGGNYYQEIYQSESTQDELEVFYKPEKERHRTKLRKYYLKTIEDTENIVKNQELQLKSESDLLSRLGFANGEMAKHVSEMASLAADCITRIDEFRTTIAKRHLLNRASSELYGVL